MIIHPSVSVNMSYLQLIATYWLLVPSNSRLKDSFATLNKVDSHASEGVKTLNL